MAERDARVRVLHHVWRLSRSGGIPAVVRELALGLDPERFDIHVSTVRPRLAEDVLEEFDGRITLHPLNVRGDSRLARTRAVAGLARVTAGLNPDILHVHSGTAWHAATAIPFARRAARILEVHDAPGEGRHRGITERVEVNMVRRLAFRPLVHSESVAATVRRVTGVEPTLIPLGIDTERFATWSTARDEWREANGIPSEAVLLLWVGRIVPSKNLPLALHVLSRLAETTAPPHLAIIGAGQHESLVSELSHVRHLVHALGPRDDLVDALHAADIFLSTSNYEGFGLAVLEAMASGLPVVATAAGGICELVEDGITGLLAPVGDEAAITSAVEAIIDDETTRAGFGAAGSARASSLFDRTAMIAAYESLYERLANTAVA